MENLAPSETLTPDLLPTESSDLCEETLAQTGNNAVVDTPFVFGDFVWAKVKGTLWWPALVSPEMKKDSVLVSYFGDCDTLAWCEPKQLKPFLQVFEEMSRQSSSSSFVRALDSCMKEIEESLELEMTCRCVPVEARPKPMVEVGSKEVPIANISAREFMDWIMDVARDVFMVNALETLQLKSWVFGLGKVLMQGESWEFRRRRGIEDLVDKIDLDALPVEMVGGKEEEEEALIIGVSKRRRRRKTMPKPIAETDLDVLQVDDGEEEEEEEVVEERSLRSKMRKSKEKLEMVKAEEDIGSSSGRRERKKSKYLSPPYTNLREVGKFLATLPKNSEEKTPRKAACFPDPSGEEDDNKSCLLKIERMLTLEFFLELVAAAENPLHLKGHRAAKVIKYFFAVYRKSRYSGGADIEEYKKLVPEPIPKTEDPVDNSGKHERSNVRNNKNGSYKETALDFKQRKRADLETKLDSEKPKRSRKNETDRDNDLDSKQKKRHSLEKQRLRKKKISKDGIGQRANINLDFHMEDASVEGKEKQKKGNNKNGISQVAPVDSDHYLANALDEGKGNQNPRRKKKRLNDGTSKRAPADLDLLMVNASSICKPGRGRKRCKNDANGEAAVNVDLQIVSSFHEGGLKKKERVCKDVAVNSQKPVLMNEKKIGGKEDANGKSFQNLGVGDTKFPDGGKAGPKKKGGTGPPKVKPGRRKAKRADPIYGRQAALQLTFHSGIALPSIDDLITSYSKYGALIDTQVELFEESNSARVVFEKAADAENAFKDKAGPYGSVATYRLHYLSESLSNPSQPNHDLVSSTPLQISDVTFPSQQSPDPKSAALKPPLPYIRKSLETMISTLAWSSSPVNMAGSSSDGLKPEARDNLVGEMQGLLQKVDKMLNGPGSSSST